MTGAIVEDRFRKHNWIHRDFIVCALSRFHRKYKRDYFGSLDPNSFDKQKSTHQTHRIEYGREQERIFYKENRAFLDRDSWIYAKAEALGLAKIMRPAEVCKELVTITCSSPPT